MPCGFTEHIECCFSKLKQFRRVATRFEKPARNYRAGAGGDQDAADARRVVARIEGMPAAAEIHLHPGGESMSDHGFGRLMSLM